MVKYILTVLAFFLNYGIFAQKGQWLAQLQRKDGNNIPFTFEWKTEAGKPVWYIQNATEQIKVTNIYVVGDSVIVQMPVFESQFRLALKNNTLSGVWLKAGAVKTQSIPFFASQNKKRFDKNESAKFNISGRWAAKFSSNGPEDLSVAEFRQVGNFLSGTFLNADGDYRFLEGVVSGDSVYLSCFDGCHSFMFTARIDNDKNISGGTFISGGTHIENWKAVKDANAKISTAAVDMHVKNGEDRLHFKFKDLNGKYVSIDDPKFKNKVVVIQLMGSWCPNCMDETAFLSEYYNKNKQRGVEVIALAYEYTTNWDRSLKSLEKFKNRFNVQYPILNTEVAVTDTLRTEKTLPELTQIKTFPSSIILDKKGFIRKLDSEFNGPATGIHYLEYKKEFETTINNLLNEK